jgi:two-component system LytT family response regulator
MESIRTLVVDDEPLARTKIRSLLAGDTDIEVIGECADGRTAVATIAAERPDLVFLDVQMPEMDGFAVLEAIAAEQMPLVIFTTAFDEYAVRAFDVYALDYLLKPIDRDRFATALERAKARLTSVDSEVAGERGERVLRPLLEELSRQHQRNARLAIKTDGRVRLIRTMDIDWIEAVDNYAKLHMGKEAHVIRDTLSRLEQRLPGDRFLRVHRSTIVNMERVKEIQPWFQSDYVLILYDGTQLTSGRSYRRKVQQYVGAMS